MTTWIIGGLITSEDLLEGDQAQWIQRTETWLSGHFHEIIGQNRILTVIG